MKNDSIRFHVARDLQVVQSLMLTTQQWDILQFIRRMPDYVRSSEISSEFGISPQHTANVMTVLFERGYVKRLPGTSPSGGPEYEFQYRVPSTEKD